MLLENIQHILYYKCCARKWGEIQIRIPIVIRHLPYTLGDAVIQDSILGTMVWKLRDAESRPWGRGKQKRTFECDLKGQADLAGC